MGGIGPPTQKGEHMAARTEVINRPLTLQLSDTEQMSLVEALQELRRVKLNALAVVNVELGSNPRVRPFTKEDFGISTLEQLISRTEALE